MLAQIVVNSTDRLRLVYVPLFRESWSYKSIVMPTMHASTMNQNTGGKSKLKYVQKKKTSKTKLAQN